MSYDFTCVWSLRNKTNGQRKEETKKPRPFTGENTLTVAEGRWEGAGEAGGGGERRAYEAEHRALSTEP